MILGQISIGSLGHMFYTVNSQSHPKILELNISILHIYVGLTMDVGQRTNLRSYMYIMEHLSNNTKSAIRREVEGDEERLDHLSPALQTSLYFTPTVSKVKMFHIPQFQIWNMGDGQGISKYRFL